MGRKFGPLLTRPELQPGDEVYVQAFEDLSERRSFHMDGPNPISVSDIAAYYAMQGLPSHRDSQRVFFRLLARMDNTYITYSVDRRQAEMEAKKREAKRSRR